MNDRLDPRILAFAPATIRPLYLMPDEPIFSYVARQWRLTITQSQESVIEELFGNAKIKICRPLHSGLNNFSRHVLGSNQYSDDLIAQHGLLAFYRPFISQTTFAAAIERTNGPPSGAKLEPTTRRSFDIFRATPAACTCCIRSDKAVYGFAYFRRSHLIQAVTHCPEHQIPLVERCLTCGASFSHWELPSLTCHHCGDQIAPDMSATITNEHVASAIRLSQFCAAVLAGQIEWTSDGNRLAAYRRRTTEVVRNRSGVVGDNLARHLEKTFGKGLLDKLGLSPHHAPTLGWPALLIHGRLLVNDPIANCLLLAALFDSPSHYIGFIASTQEFRSVENETPRRQLISVGEITLQLIRDAISLPQLRLASARHGTCYGVLKQWVGAYPGLSERRNAKFLLNKLAKHKQALVDLLTASPELSRAAVTKLRKGAMKFVLRHDPQWLDEALPRRWQAVLVRDSKTKAAERIPCDDVQALNWLQEALSEELVTPVRPIRRTMQRLLRLSGLEHVAPEGRSAFPVTMNLIQAAVESEEIYFHRKLQWAANDLRGTYERCDNLIEMFVHAQVPVKLVRSLEGFAKTLIDN